MPKHIFTPKEDRVISKMVALNKSWKDIAAALNLNVRQVRERYTLTLDPEIDRSELTPDENRTLVSLVQRYGPEWTKVAKHMKHRSVTQIKNRYYRIKRFMNKGYTVEEAIQRIGWRIRCPRTFNEKYGIEQEKETQPTETMEDPPEFPFEINFNWFSDEYFNEETTEGTTEATTEGVTEGATEGVTEETIVQPICDPYGDPVQIEPRDFEPFEEPLSPLPDCFPEEEMLF